MWTATTAARSLRGMRPPVQIEMRLHGAIESKRTPGKTLGRIGRVSDSYGARLEETRNRLRPRLVVFVEREDLQMGKVASEFPRARQIRRHSGGTDRARLQNRTRQTFPERRENRHVSGRNPVQRFLDFAHELDVAAEPRVGGGPTHFLAVVADLLPDQLKAHVRHSHGNTPENADETQLIFEWLDGSHAHDGGSPGSH